MVTDKEDWLTRPVRRSALLAAKLLFLLLFIHLPFLISDILILSWSGFLGPDLLPALLIRQLVLLAMFTLPAALLAAVTGGLGHYVLGALLILAALALRMAAGGHMGALWGGVSWVRWLFYVGLILPSAGLILWLQYGKRRTIVSRLILIPAVVIAITVTGMAPPEPVFAIQSAFSSPRTPATAGSIQFHPETTPARREFAGYGLRIRPSGLPAQTAVGCNQARVTLETSSGEKHHLQQAHCLNTVPEAMWLTLPVKHELYERLRYQPVRLRATMHFTLMGDPAAHSMPDLGSANMRDIGQCRWTAFARELDALYCQAPSWMEARQVALVDPQSGEILAHSLMQGSYGPIPIVFSLSPVSNWVFSFGHRDNWTRATIPDLRPSWSPKILKPLTHFRREITIDNLILASLEPKER